MGTAPFDVTDLQIPDRLEKDNPHVKLKCLKIIKHVSWHISKLVSVGRMEKHMSERDWECVLNIWGLFLFVLQIRKAWTQSLYARGCKNWKAAIWKKCYMILNCCMIPIPHDPIASTNSKWKPRKYRRDLDESCVYVCVYAICWYLL